MFKLKMKVSRYCCNILLMNNYGSSMLAVLLLIPALTAGGLALYKANMQPTVTLGASGDSLAYYAAQTGTNQVLDYLYNNSASAKTQMDLIFDPNSLPSAGDDVASFGDNAIDTSGLSYTTSNSYSALTARYKATWVLHSKTDKNSIYADWPAIQVEARIYNGAGNWGSPYIASYTLTQEFHVNRDDTVPTGCARNYDFWAQNDFQQSSMMNMSMFSGQSVYYTGDDWNSDAMTGFSVGKAPCIDAVDDVDGVCDGMMITVPMVGDICGGKSNCDARDVTCDFTPVLSFGSAIGLAGFGPDEDPNTPDDVNWINVCGYDKSVGGSSCGPDDSGRCPDLDNDGDQDSDDCAAALPYADSWEQRVLSEVTNGMNDLHAAKAAGITKAAGSFHFLDMNDNGLPDTPYFYFADSSSGTLAEGNDRDLTTLIPALGTMFNMRTVYIYVKGDIKSFQFMNGGMMNFKKLYVIAKHDISSFSMMNMNMLDSGVVFIAGGYFRSNSMMGMSGLAKITIFANENIEINGGLMQMDMLGRSHMVSGNDINMSSMMTGSFLNSGATICNASCEAGDTTPEDAPELIIGDQYSYSPMSG